MKVLQGVQIKRRVCTSRKQSLTPGLGVLGLPEEHSKEEGHNKGLQPCCEASEKTSGLVFLPAACFSWETGQAYPVRAAGQLGRLEHKFIDRCTRPHRTVRSAAAASATSLHPHIDWQPLSRPLPCLCCLLTPSWSCLLPACVSNTTCHGTWAPGPQGSYLLVPEHLFSAQS